MINILKNDLQDTFKEITTTSNLKSKTVKTKNNTFDEVLKNNVSNSESVKQNKFSKNKEDVKVKEDVKWNEDVKVNDIIELDVTDFNDEQLNYISQMLCVNRVDLKEIIGKLNLDETPLNIESPKIDLYIIIKENLEAKLDDNSLNLINSLNNHMSFDIFSLEDYKNSSNKDIVNILKFIENFKNPSTEINKEESLNFDNKYTAVNENQDTTYIKNEVKSFNTKEVSFNEERFLKSLIKPDDRLKPGIDESKVNITIDKFTNMGNKDLSNNLDTNLNIGKENFDYGIVKTMKFMDLSNMKELTLKIIPKELGEIIIRVTLENNILKANVKASTKEGYELLQDNINSIKEKLTNSSIKIQEFSVDIYDNNSMAGNDKNFKGNNSQENSPNKFNNNTKSEDQVGKQDNNSTDTINDMFNMLA